MKNKTVCIIGLDDVGLLLAKAFVIENKSVESVLICVFKNTFSFFSTSEPMEFRTRAVNLKHI